MFCSPSKLFCLSEKVFFLPEKVFFLPAKVFCFPAKVFCLPAKVFCFPAKVFCFPAKVFCLPAKVFCGQARCTSPRVRACVKTLIASVFWDSESPTATNIKAWGEAVSAEPQDRRSMKSLPEGEQQARVLLVAFSDRNLYSHFPRVPFARSLHPGL